MKTASSRQRFMKLQCDERERESLNVYKRKTMGNSNFLGKFSPIRRNELSHHRSFVPHDHVNVPAHHQLWNASESVAAQKEFTSSRHPLLLVKDELKTLLKRNLKIQFGIFIQFLFCQCMTYVVLCDKKATRMKGFSYQRFSLFLSNLKIKINFISMS